MSIVGGRKRSTSITNLFSTKRKEASSSESSPGGGDGEDDISSLLEEKKKKKNKGKKDKSSSRSDCREPSPTAEQQEIAQLKKEIASLNQKYQKLDNIVTMMHNEPLEIAKERPLCECVLF